MSSTAATHYTPADLDAALDERLAVSLADFAELTGEPTTRIRSRVDSGRFRYPVVRLFGNRLMIRTADLRPLLGGASITPQVFVRRLAAQDPDALTIADRLARGDSRYRIGSGDRIVDTRSAATGPTSAESFLAENTTIGISDVARLLGMAYLSIDTMIRENRFPLEVLNADAPSPSNPRQIRSADLLSFVANAPAIDKAAA